MTVHRRYLGWGVFLVCLGIVPLAVQLGIVDARVAQSVLRLWPFILIGIGLSLVLRMTRYSALGTVVSSAVIGLVAGVFFAGGLASPAFVCAGSEPAAAPTTQTGSFTGSSADISIELTCGNIDVSRGTGPDWSVTIATDGEQPVIRTDADALDLRSANTRVFASFPGGTDERWQVILPSSTSVSAGVTLNAASGHLAFGNGAVSHVSATYNGSDSVLDLRGAAGASSVSATLNASTVRLLMPEAPIEASLTLNVSSLTVCVPPASAVRIQYSNTLGTDNFAAAGFVGGGENWSTPGLASAASELHISSNVSSITLDRSGECQ